MGNLFSAREPHTYNVTLTVADTEYSQVLPDGCKRFSIDIRSGVETNNYRFAFESGKVATPTAPYIQYPCDLGYYETDLNSSITLYIAGSNAGDVAQIIAWV